MVALLPMPALAEESGDGKELDIPEIVLEHLADAYEWHIASYEGKHLSIPLPIIIRSENTGEWHFCTAHSLPEGFFLSEEHHGKIYEHMADGTEARPLDLSITKSVLQIWIVVIVLIVIFLSCARWYKKHDVKDEAPGGFVGMMEMIVMTIHDDLIKSSIGEKHYKPYAPYLLTVFFFILTCNLIGLIPVFPGGANVTGNINITFFLAICTMLAINIFANKEYWKEIFWPDVPLFLKAYPAPVMPVIELFGVFTKPFALMIREGLSRTGDASHRTLRSIHEALRADDPSLCQHDGRSRSDFEFHLCDFPRLVNGCRIWSRPEHLQYHYAAVYECT